MSAPTENLLSNALATLQTDTLLGASLLAVTWDTGPAIHDSQHGGRRGSISATGEWAVKWTDPSSSEPISLTPLSLQPETHPGFPRRLEEERKGGILAMPSSGVGEPEMVRRSGTQTSADYAALFSSRLVVQAPSKIEAVSEKGAKSSYAVYFLLNKSAASPESVVIEYTPQIWSPNAQPLVSPPIGVQPAGPQEEHLTSWANHRLNDLRALAAIARELQTTGSRNAGTGLLKRGVDGMGMDMKAIENEAKMVHEELNWVRELLAAVAREGIFTGYGIGEASEEDPTVEEEREAIEKALAEMSILAQELKTRRNSITQQQRQRPNIPKGPTLNTAFAIEKQQQKSLMNKVHLHTPDSQQHPSPTDANDDHGLFAVPLSPRSPEMPISPFSALKGLPDALFLQAQQGKNNFSPTSNPAPSSMGFHPINTSSSGARLDAGKSVPQPLRIPKSAGGMREELAGIVVRSPREPTTPTLAHMPNPEELRRKRNWGAERI